MDLLLNMKQQAYDLHRKILVKRRELFRANDAKRNTMKECGDIAVTRLRKCWMESFDQSLELRSMKQLLETLEGSSILYAGERIVNDVGRHILNHLKLRTDGQGWEFCRNSLMYSHKQRFIQLVQEEITKLEERINDTLLDLTQKISVDQSENQRRIKEACEISDALTAEIHDLEEQLTDLNKQIADMEGIEYVADE